MEQVQEVPYSGLRRGLGWFGGLLVAANVILIADLLFGLSLSEDVWRSGSPYFVGVLPALLISGILFIAALIPLAVYVFKIKKFSVLLVVAFLLPMLSTYLALRVATKFPW